MSKMIIPCQKHADGECELMIDFDIIRGGLLSQINLLKAIIKVLKEENQGLKQFLLGLGYTLIVDEKGKVSIRYDY